MADPTPVTPVAPTTTSWLTNLKSIAVNLIVIVLLALLLWQVERWWTSTPKTFQVILNGPASAPLGEVIPYSVTMNNKPFWLKQTLFKWTVTNSEGPVNFNQIDSTHIDVGAGVNQDNLNVTVDGVGLYNPFWVHPILEIFPIQTMQTAVGTNPTSINKWLIAIFDKTKVGTLPPTQQAIYNSITIENSLHPLGYYWKIYDINDIIPIPNLQPNGVGTVSQSLWGEEGIAVGLPALVGIDNTGNIVDPAVKLPADENTIVQTAKSFSKRR